MLTAVALAAVIATAVFYASRSRERDTRYRALVQEYHALCPSGLRYLEAEYEQVRARPNMGGLPEHLRKEVERARAIRREVEALGYPPLPDRASKP